MDGVRRADPAGRTPVTARTVRDARARAGPVFEERLCRDAKNSAFVVAPYSSSATGRSCSRLAQPLVLLRDTPPQVRSALAAGSARRPRHRLRHPAVGELMQHTFPPSTSIARPRMVSPTRSRPHRLPTTRLSGRGGPGDLAGPGDRATWNEAVRIHETSRASDSMDPRDGQQQRHARPRIVTFISP